MISSIQTNGIGKLNVGSVKTVNSKNRTEEHAADTFAGLMNLSGQTIQADNRNSKDVNTATSTLSSEKPMFSANVDYSKNTDSISKKEITNQSDEKTADAYASKSTQTREVKRNETDSKSKEVSNNASDNVSKDNTSVNKTKLDEAQAELSEKLKQALGMDDEQLQQLLADAGLSMQELLNPDVLQQFVLQAEGATSVDLLIDETLNQTMNALLQGLEDILQEKGLTESDISEMLPVEEIETMPEEEIVKTEVAEQDPVAKESNKIGNENAESGYVSMNSETAENDSQTQTVQSEIKVTVQAETGEQAGAQNGQTNDNPADTILANLNQAVTQAVGNEAAEVNGFSEQISQADILRQVVDEIKVSMSRDVNSLSVQLNPEQLGKVQIHVVSKNGVMQAQIIAENEVAKNAVEAGLSTLKEAFESQDLKVDAIEVMVGTNDYFAESGQDAENGNPNREKSGNKMGGINLNDISDDEISEDKQLEAEMMKAQGNRVNYMA